MSEIQRYYPTMDANGAPYLKEHSDGYWVRFADVEPFLNAAAALGVEPARVGEVLPEALRLLKASAWYLPRVHGATSDRLGALRCAEDIERILARLSAAPAGEETVQRTDAYGHPFMATKEEAARLDDAERQLDDAELLQQCDEAFSSRHWTPDCDVAALRLSNKATAGGYDRLSYELGDRLRLAVGQIRRLRLRVQYLHDAAKKPGQLTDRVHTLKTEAKCLQLACRMALQQLEARRDGGRTFRDDTVIQELRGALCAKPAPDAASRASSTPSSPTSSRRRTPPPASPSRRKEGRAMASDRYTASPCCDNPGCTTAHVLDADRVMQPVVATFTRDEDARAYAAILNVCVESGIETANGLTAFNRRISARINELADEMETDNG